MSMGTTAPGDFRLGWSKRQARAGGSLTLKLQPISKPRLDGGAAAPTEPPSAAEQAALMSSVDLHVQVGNYHTDKTTPTDPSAPQSYVPLGEFRSALRHSLGSTQSEPDFSPQRLVPIFDDIEREKAEDYRASLPPSAADKLTSAVAELSPLGDIENLHTAYQEGSPASALWTVAGAIPALKF